MLFFGVSSYKFRYLALADLKSAPKSIILAFIGSRGEKYALLGMDIISSGLMA
jgi:hypothetical protein